MPLPDEVRVAHMVDAARRVMKATGGRTRSDLDTDDLLAPALVHWITVVGEAAGRVSPEWRARVPGLPWGEIVGMRNKLIHGYYDVDLDVVWRVARQEIPSLVTLLSDALDAQRSE